ncbi:putative carboxylesterase [Penicillium brasilianum]|uniref:Carboxylic ester hydrolase n=1 Tax=Penicillium brasilianum TaxID=104259 RepID=A0A1S9S0S6_PENBI|nr:putative carboxylesterase [Penicillium brasilianum]
MVSLSTTYLGEIRGETDGNVEEYLGIPYATLRNRWADAVLVSDREGPVLDVTNYGPTAVSPPSGCDLEFSIMQHSLPRGDLPQSHTGCLNLNISIPHTTEKPPVLPVFVFIHGGGYEIGASSWPQFKLARTDENYPSYRLGPFGFLTSDELRQRGYKANNGLRDQRVALNWIARHIADFGGDPENITVAGVSAGGASVMHHLHSTQPLFKRAIVMSGSYFLLPPLPLSKHEENYKEAMAALGLKHLPVDERIKALLDIPAQEIASHLLRSVIAAPAIDGDIITECPTFADLAAPNNEYPKAKAWCEELLVGDVQMDGNIIRVLMPGAEVNCADKFTGILKAILHAHPETAQKILDHYGISPSNPDDQVFTAVLDYFNDIAFFMPTLAAAQGWAGKAFVYYFNEGNSWDGPTKGRAGHLLDTVYLFENFREFLEPEQQALGRQFAGGFIKFCHGRAPWGSVESNDLEKGFNARVYGSRDGSDGAVRDVHYPFGGDTDRRGLLWECAREGVSLDQLLEVFHLFRGF